MEQLPWERLQIAIGAVAAAQAAIDWTVDYVKERKVFGQPVAAFQNTRFKLAEMQTEVQVARVFVDKCCELIVPRPARHGHRQHGQVLVHRPAVQGDGRVRAAVWRLRLHVGIPHHPRLCRCPRAAHLRRHQRDHERSDHAGHGAGRALSPGQASAAGQRQRIQRAGRATRRHLEHVGVDHGGGHV